MTIRVNLEPLESTADLPYLGFTVTFKSSNWAALKRNIRKAQRRWGMVAKLTTKTGAMVRAHAMMYKAVEQRVLLYGSENLVVTKEMLKVMEGLHYQIAMNVAGMSAQRVGKEGWELSLRNHFNKHHWEDSLTIMEKYPSPLPHCERCGRQVPP